MPPVTGGARQGFVAFHEGRAVIGRGHFAQAPGIAEVVFGACAAQAGLGIAVNKPEIIPFAPPARQVLAHAEHGAHVMAGTRDVGYQVALAGHGGKFLAVHGVKISGVRREFFHLLPVHIIIKGAHHAGAIVGHSNPGGNLKRHGPVTVARAAFRSNGHRQRLERMIHTVPHAEKITQGRFHRRRFFAVPIHSDHQQAGIPFVPGGNRIPDVVDNARSFQLRNSECFARRDRPRVGIAGQQVRIAGRGTHGAALFQSGQVFERITLRFRR
ncbi:MAG: hypothetical protein BWY09_02584 [Candidatus Hydrogenedentes bacterium ADurb.Bin179]|nr:MAG: hypothetical protein BWY09_02584 [Candidatus Hydrogenedentes bacterium ADurb.Bin179]